MTINEIISNTTARLKKAGSQWQKMEVLADAKARVEVRFEKGDITQADRDFFFTWHANERANAKPTRKLSGAALKPGPGRGHKTVSEPAPAPAPAPAPRKRGFLETLF